MKRARMIGVMAGGLVLIVATLLLALTQNARAADRLLPLPQKYLSTGLLDPTAGVTCTLTTSQTVGTPTNTSFGTALLLSPANNLALVPHVDVPPGNSVDVLSVDNYFFLNVFTGNSVSISAAPGNQSAGNYNLGMDIYDGSQTLIASDTNTADFSAEVDFIAAFSGQIYVRIYQLNAAARCTGGLYSISFT